MKNKVSFAEKDERLQDLVRCKVKIYKLSTMQRCPYIHEMKERLLGEQIPTETSQKKIPTPPPFIMDQSHNQQTVATVVKLNPDGYGSHTSPTHHRNDRTPLMPKEPEDDFRYVERSMYPKNAKTSLFIIMSFVYAKLLVVVCVAYVISDVVTHNIPLFYYEGFFTYLYGMSILFLLYVFCFLLQESTCCSGGNETPPVKPKQDKALQKKQAKEKEKERKKEEERKKKEEEKKKKEEKEKLKKEKKEKDKEKEKDKDKKTKKQEKREKFPRKMRDIVQQRAPLIQEQQPPPAAPPAPLPPTPSTPCTQGCDVEAGNVARPRRKRKTTQSDQSYGSFFLRIGAIAFGLGTMIYNGLEFGSFFEIPFTSPCYMILQGVNPVLQMVFTFMQMYFIFMNSRLNIHRFKVIARFGLMHVVATNICVWIRTLVLEYINEVTLYHKRLFNHTGIAAGVPQIADSFIQHTLRNAPTNLRTHVRVPDVLPVSTAGAPTVPTTTVSPLRDLFRVTNRVATTTLATLPHTFPTTARRTFTNPPTYPTFPTKAWKYVQTTFTTRPFTTTQSTTSVWRAVTSTPSSVANQVPFYPRGGFNNFEANNVVNVAEERDTETVVQSGIDSGIQSIIETGIKALNGSELMEDITPQAYTSFNSTMQVINGTTSCGRVNIMGTIVKDSAPYLFPFIIEYSLIGAAVIYVMWKHIGQNPRYITEEDLEHRLEIMLSRRAVAMAHAQQVRVDCVGASKGLFFGLLMLVGSLICLILFFVLIQHPDFGLLAIYLADVSHCVLMVLSIIAIIIGFIRVQSLKFKTEEQNDLNDILLRVSAFGLFLYAVFSVIAGHLNAFTNEPNLLVMVTGGLAIVQVTLQLLFIADVSRRRVHLPEHDRSKPGRQVVTFLLICNVTMWIIYTFEVQKVEANPVQLDFYGFLAWAIVQRVCLPLCIFHRFHSAVALAEIWKGSYKARLE